MGGARFAEVESGKNEKSMEPENTSQYSHTSQYSQTHYAEQVSRMRREGVQNALASNGGLIAMRNLA
jgi:hypothetical protein